MILYATLGVADFDRAIRFYDPVMAALGIARAPEWNDEFIGWGKDYDHGVSVWLCKPFNGEQPSPGNGALLSFAASNAEQVNAFHAAAMAYGGSDEGVPGLRPHYTPHFYAAYVRDPDGNKLAAVFHRFGLD